MKQAAVIVMLGVSGPVAAQELPVRVPDGASWTITAHHEHVDSGGKNGDWGLTTVKRLTLEKPIGAAQGRLTITPISATPDPGSPAELASARSLAIPAIVEVDAALEPGAVVNVEEVRTAFAKVVGREIKGMEQMADAAAQAMIVSEEGYAARLQGLTFDKGRPFSTEGLVGSPLGGPPIQTTETYSLQSYDPASGRASVTWRQVFNPKSLRKSMAAMVATAPPEKQAQARATFDAMSVEMETVCRGDIDGPTGLAVDVDCNIAVSVKSGEREQIALDRWRISQSPPHTR